MKASVNKVRKPARPKSARLKPGQKARPRRPAREKRYTLAAFVRLERSAVIFLIFAFCLVHWAIRLAVSPVYTIEEADQLLMSQSFQAGYEARQPPMLAWLHALVSVGGPHQAAVYGLKYVLMFVGLTAYYLAARNVLIRPGVSAAALAAWALTFQAGWGMHEDLLGAVALMACLSLTLHALTRILTWRRARDWAYLGLAIGLGKLTHHLFAILPVALLVATAFSPFFRPAIRPGRLILALAIAVAIYSPYVIWVATHASSITDAMAGFVESWEIDNAWLVRARNGALALALTMLEFSLPLILFWLLLFWALWLPILYPVFDRRSTDEEPHEAAWRQLFARTILLGSAAYLVPVLAGVQTFEGYWPLPALFVAPIWLFSHVQRAGDFPVAIRAFAAIAIASVVIVIGGRIVEWRLEIVTCEEGGCRPYAPIKPWADELRLAGFAGGTIVGADKHLTGNLRAAFPRARVLDASLPPSAFPAPEGYGSCLAVWRDPQATDANLLVMPPELGAYLTDDLATPPRDMGPDGAIRRNLRLSRDKAATLYFQFVPPSDACR